VTRRDYYRATTDELLDALKTLGFVPADRLRLRFSFETATPTQATHLAGDLRAHARGERVHVGPQPLPATDRHRWAVALKTPPTRLDQADIRRLDSEMQKNRGPRPGPVLPGVEADARANALPRPARLGLRGLPTAAHPGGLLAAEKAS
jgi:hypothetical protein